MDSKMECMRALAENDRQVEGCFTSFSSAMARPVLKMDRFWQPDGQAARRQDIVPVPVQEPRPTPPETPAKAPETRRENALARPGRPPSLFDVKPDSPFADKLRQALQPAAPSQEN
jgi:hypothetical protein